MSTTVEFSRSADWFVAHSEVGLLGIDSVFQFSGRLPAQWAPSTRCELIIARGGLINAADGTGFRSTLIQPGKYLDLDPGQSRYGFGVRFGPGAVHLLNHSEARTAAFDVGSFLQSKLDGITHRTQDVDSLREFGELVVRYLGNPLYDRSESIAHLRMFDELAKDGLSPGAAARTLGLSRERLLRVSGMSGMSAMRYSQLSRVREAIDLLCTGRNCGYAAIKLGFSSNSHLSNESRHTIGYPPTVAAKLVRTQQMHLRMRSPSSYYDKVLAKPHA